MNESMLSIIVVSYNTRDLLKNCLNSIVAHTTTLDHEIVVVDNNSCDGSQDMVRKDFPGAILICNDSNAGFSKANNRGVRSSNGAFLLFLNSDTLIRNRSLCHMLDYIVENNRMGIVGPRIVNGENKPTRSYMRFLDVKCLFLGSKYLSFLIDVKKYRLHYDHYDFETTRIVPWLSGACFMMRRSVFEEVGGFDEGYFLYLEDMDLCLQVHRKGYRNIYLPKAEIVHLFGGSSDPLKVNLKFILRSSIEHYFKKNYSAIDYWFAKIYCAAVYR